MICSLIQFVNISAATFHEFGWKKRTGLHWCKDNHRGVMMSDIAGARSGSSFDDSLDGIRLISND